MDFLPTDNNFADILDDDTIYNSQPISLPSSQNTDTVNELEDHIPNQSLISRPLKHTGQQGEFRCTAEVDPKYRFIFTYPYFNLVQSRVIEDALYSDKSMVICAPTGSGKTVVFEMAIVQLLMEIEDKNYNDDFKIIYMAPVKSLCTERLTEWYPKLTKLGLLCIEVTGDTDVEFSQLKPYRVIITTPEKWDMLTRRWKDYRGLVEVVKLFLIDEVHILNDEIRGPVLEAVVSRMKTIESSAQSAHRIEQLQKQYGGNQSTDDVTTSSPRIRFVAVSATVNNPDDVATWLGTADKPAVYYKFGDECRPVKLTRIVEGYPCSQGTSIFKFDIILNYKLWPIIQKYHNGKPTLIFCNTRKSVALTAEALSREITVNFNPEQKAKLTALASTIKNKKLQALILNGVGCHHAGLLYEERMNIEYAFRNRNLPILITTTTLAMGVNLPAHLVIIKNTQQYVNGAYQEYSISTILQMVGRAGRPQFDTAATAVIMTRMADKARYQALVEGTEPLQSFLHKRLAENLNSEAALGTVTDVAQCVQWVNSTFLSVRAAKDPRRYLGLPHTARANEISKKIEELCVRAMNGLASSGLITMDEVSCIGSTEAGKLMSMYYIDMETMKLIMKIEGSETLDRLMGVLCESHELSDMHLRVDERRCLNALNRNNTAATIRFPMKGKITSRQMKLNCVIQAVLGCLPIPDPSLAQEATKIMRIALRVCKCLVAYTTRPASVSYQPKTFSAVLNSIILTKCLTGNLWENSPYVSKQLRGIGPAFSMLLASAGKTNFTLLEESHPRDLERIMNKGPPAGNVIRKQVSLLPKYQLTISPIDKDKIFIQLTLLNLAYLSENLENLTAGINHKSYIIVGDSENYLLYLMSFNDGDLIKIYDGCISCEVTRKHSHQHQVKVYCISSSFVGIDVQSEYLFINIGPASNSGTATSNTNNDLAKPIYLGEQKAADRKRKLNKNKDVTYSKEKVKRDNNLLENFKYLKESFGKASKEILGKLNKNTEMSGSTLENISHSKSRVHEESCQSNVSKNTSPKELISMFSDYSTEKDDFEFLEDDEMVNNILTKIENEMGQNVTNKGVREQPSPLPVNNVHYSNILKYKRQAKETRRPQKHAKYNYNFIDVLDKDIDFNNSNDHFDKDNIDGFTNTVKLRIDKYLQNAEITKSKYKNVNELLEINDSVKKNQDDKQPLSNATLDQLLIDYHNVHEDQSVIRDNRNIVGERQSNDNDSTLIRNSNILLKHNAFSEEIDENIDTIIDISECNRGTDIHNIDEREILRQIGIPKTEHLNVTSTSAPLLNISRTLGDNKLILGVPLKHEIINNNQLCLNKTSSSLVSVVHDSKNLGNYVESRDSETCLEDTKEKGICFPPYSSTSRNNNFTMPVLYSNSDVKCANHSTHNIENGAQIEKYCFRSQNFNICTINDSKHIVKVISNIKIDLDIAKIITTKEEKASINKIVIKDTEYSRSNNIKSDTNREINNLDKIELENVERTHDIIATQDSSQESIKSQTLISDIEEQCTDLLKTKGSNKIENIVKKFSKIIRKPNIAELFAVKQANNENTLYTPIEKPKRRYNINDIEQSLNPISKNIIENDKKLMNFNSKIIERSPHTVTQDDLLCVNTGSALICNDISENESLNTPPLPDDIFSKVNSDKEINMEVLMALSNLEPKHETFNFNQAFLNPKTLLECYNNEDEVEQIIPPPPEFADTAIGASHNDSINSYTLFPPDYNPEIYNCDVMNTSPLCEVRKTRNNFLPSKAGVTSKDTKTWAISPANNKQISDLHKRPITGYTVIRDNSSDRRSLFSNNSRSISLDAYKFKRKNLFKINK